MLQKRTYHSGLGRRFFKLASTSSAILHQIWDSNITVTFGVQTSMEYHGRDPGISNENSCRGSDRIGPLFSSPLFGKHGDEHIPRRGLWQLQPFNASRGENDSIRRIFCKTPMSRSTRFHFLFLFGKICMTQRSNWVSFIVADVAS